MTWRDHPNVISSGELDRENSVLFSCVGRGIDINGDIGEPTWRVLRPVSCPTFRERLQAAWRVFTGEYDALSWRNRGRQP